ncbi:tetratricopeptide repeat protein [Flavobacterium oreochromis]|uniref:tetratricopeptide repeat protein n=1 Tax=Flavobacterium oreochromis TaxID=2906078 RepID=UPI003858CE63
MQSIDKYVVQALDNYPYWLEGTLESLGYALAYDNKNVMALGLYGRLYAEQMQDYEAAKQYYAEALAADIHALAIYPHYAEVLLLNEDYEEASKLIDFSLTIKGINKAQMLLKKIQLLERQQDIKAALKMIKEVKLISFTNDSYEIDEIEKRLKAKKELLKPKKSKKKKKSEKKDKKK